MDLTGRPIAPLSERAAICSKCEGHTHLGRAPNNITIVTYCSDCLAINISPYPFGEAVITQSLGVLLWLRDKYPPTARDEDLYTISDTGVRRRDPGTTTAERAAVAPTREEPRVGTEAKKTRPRAEAAQSRVSDSSIWSRLRWLFTGRST